MTHSTIQKQCFSNRYTRSLSLTFIFFMALISPCYAELNQQRIDQFKTRLADPSAEIRYTTLKEIRQSGPDISPLIPSLIQSLYDYDKVHLTDREYVTPSREAEEILISLGDSAVPQLIEALSAPDISKRRRIPRVLTRINQLCRDEVIKAAIDERITPYVAGDALSYYGTRDLDQTLLTYLKSDAPKVRLLALQIVDYLQESEKNDEGKKILLQYMGDDNAQIADTAAKALTRYRKFVMRDMIKFLKEGTARQRQSAYITLKALKDSAAPAMTVISKRLMQTDDLTEARQALDLLAGMTRTRGIYFFINTDNDKNAEKRSQNTHQRQQAYIRETAEDYLMLALNHPNEKIQKMAMQYAVRLKLTGMVYTTLQRLRRAKTTDQIKTELSHLNRMANDSKHAATCIEAVLPFLDNDDQSVVTLACRVIGQAGNTHASEMAIKALVQKFDLNTTKPDQINDQLYQSAAFALANLGDQRAVDHMVLFLENDIQSYQAIDSLAKVGSEKGGQAILNLLNQRRGRITKLIEALGKLKYTPAIHPLIGIIAVHYDDEDSVYAYSAAHALGDIGKPALEPVIRVACDKRNSLTLRQTLVRALGYSREKSAVPALIEFLDDENEQIRINATQGLRDINHLPFGNNIEQWKKWWEENQVKFLQNLTEH